VADNLGETIALMAKSYCGVAMPSILLTYTIPCGMDVVAHLKAIGDHNLNSRGNANVIRHGIRGMSAYCRPADTWLESMNSLI